MPSLALLERPSCRGSARSGCWRGYLLFAFALVIVKVVDVAIGKLGVNASEPTIPATCTSARLVRRAIQGTAHGPNEFGRAVGRSHLSSVHLHDYSCQSVDNIDCHNNQEE